jgi:hypothetical protein
MPIPMARPGRPELASLCLEEALAQILWEVDGADSDARRQELRAELPVMSDRSRRPPSSCLIPDRRQCARYFRRGLITQRDEDHLVSGS